MSDGAERVCCRDASQEVVNLSRWVPSETISYDHSCMSSHLCGFVMVHRVPIIISSVLSLSSLFLLCMCTPLCVSPEERELGAHINRLIAGHLSLAFVKSSLHRGLFVFSEN